MMLRRTSCSIVLVAFLNGACHTALPTGNDDATPTPTPTPVANVVTPGPTTPPSTVTPTPVPPPVIVAPPPTTPPSTVTPTPTPPPPVIVAPPTTPTPTPAPPVVIVMPPVTPTPTPTLPPLVVITRVVHREGSYALTQSSTFDLDEGRVNAGTASDIWFQAETATRRFLSPQNGALLRNVGTQAPDWPSCHSAALSDSRIDISTLSVGDYLCVKTSSSRYSRVKVLLLPGPSSATASLSLSFTTWD
jgi:hypothetical protein